MTAIQLHSKQHVGTTYKRALERFHQSRDGQVSRDFKALRLIERSDNWFVHASQGKDRPMRKPRDYDAELKALTDKARQLKTRKQSQLGELVIATGADTLSIDLLAGVLLAAVETSDHAMKEVWRKRGAAFFHGRAPSPGSDAGENARRIPTNEGGAASPTSPDRAQ
jgi:hypothetical protein